MSGKLTITFAPDMPAAAVEVVAPDWSTVDRIWLSPGQQKSVEVPSEASFLRVHLASGATVSLQDPGKLDRFITKAMLTSRRDTPRATPEAFGVKQRRSIRQLQQISNYETPFTPGPVSFSGAPDTTIEGDINVMLVGPDSMPEPGQAGDAGASVKFEPPAIQKPYELVLEAKGLSVKVRIPGMLKELLVSSDDIGDEGARVVTIRVRTESAIADTIGGYMKRGDLHSAETITDWAEKAEDLLDQKIKNPFAAAVGAYLLLRLRRFDLMHDWMSNLANWFPDVPDGRVILAWQQIYTRGDEQKIRELLQQALASPLPVFTDGMRLLRDGAHAIGADAALAELNERCGVVLWNSPFTTSSFDRSNTKTGETTTAPITVNIDYAPSL